MSDPNSNDDASGLDDVYRLTVDRGNTTLDMCCWRGGWPVFRDRVLATDHEAIAGAIGRMRNEGGAPTECLAANVVVGGLDQLAVALSENRIPLRIAGVDIASPLDLKYDEPETLGIDRWVGAYAAYCMLLEATDDTRTAAVTVDCGTALTVNVVDRSGRFLGGAIGPGPMTWVNGLAHAAPSLPLGQIEADAPLPARSTQDAVNAGIQRGFAGAVDGLVTACLEESGLDLGLPVYATGGDAEVLLRWGKRSYEHVPDLVHRGLQALAVKYPLQDERPRDVTG